MGFRSLTKAANATLDDYGYGSSAVLDEYTGVPGDWAEFAGSIQIRSGLRFTPFTPFDYQRRIVSEIMQRSALITKGRQLGASITISNWMLWRVLREGIVTLSTSRTQEDAFELSKKVRSQLNYLAPEWGVVLERDSLSELAFTNGGRMLFRAPVDDLGRSLDSIGIGFLDEAQSLANLDVLQGAVSSVQDACGDDARMIICGTPPEHRLYPFWVKLTEGNGDRDFDDICKQIREQRVEPFQAWVDADGWSKIVFDYHCHPIHSQNSNYIEDVIRKRKITRAQAMREYALLVPSIEETSAFSFELVQAAVEGDFSHIPHSRYEYYLGVDPSFSSKPGRDYCSCVVLRKEGELCRVVHLYRKRGRGSMLHLNAIADIIRRYRPVRGVVESVSGALAWVEALQAAAPETEIEGFATGPTNRDYLLNRITMALENGHLKMPQCEIVSDLLAMQRSDAGKIEMSRSSSKGHGDSAFGLAFALHAARYEGFVPLPENPEVAALLEDWRIGSDS